MPSISPRAQTAPHPIIFLESYEIAAIKIKVNQNVEPWSSAYTAAISAAESALSQPGSSVIENGGGINSGANYFATDAPYKTDGVYDPKADRKDYENAINISHAVRDLGLAYAFSGQTKYAAKATELIKTWTVDARTRMMPAADNFGPETPNHDSGGSIEVFITMPALIYGADLISNYSSWNSTEKTTFSDWVRELGYDAKDRRTYRNNFENWRLVLISTAGSFLNDADLLNYAFDRYKTIIPDQINSQGQMVKELGRTKSLSYSLYALNAMIQTAEVARHQGVNLYDYETSGGRGLKLALDYHDDYAANPNTWPYQQIEPLNANDNVALYELAYSYWQEPGYYDVITRWGRPMHEIRTLDHVSLTHANRFAFSLPPILTPTPIPKCLTWSNCGSWINE